MSVNQGVMRIGEVHAQLRAIFPDIELSKIRYYEDKGLVQPSRSRKGYRLYSERDVTCLREAIRLAQEEFVPLRVVRLRLIEQGLLVEPNVTPSVRQAAREASLNVVSAPAPPARPVLNLVAPAASESDAAASSPSLNTNELLAKAGLTPEMFNQIQAIGLLTPVIFEGVTTYGASDVRVAALAGALLARGVDPRVLGSLRRICERKIGVIDEVTRAFRVRTRSPSREELPSIVTDVAREVNDLCNALLEREVAAYLND